MGYCVNPDYYGNGYATWGVSEFLKIYWNMEGVIPFSSFCSYPAPLFSSTVQIVCLEIGNISLSMTNLAPLKKEKRHNNVLTQSSPQ